MPKIDFGQFIQSIAIALVLFAIGRLIVTQMEDVGRWVIFAAVIIFYAAWWIFYQRKKRKK